MTKVIDFNDGFSSGSQPTAEGAIASFYKAYANNAAYEAVFTAVAGSVFWDTTLDVEKVYDGTNWRTTERALDNAEAGDPGVSNDNTEGYEVLSLWLNTSSGAFFRATDVSTGAAAWQEVAADSVLDSHISATVAHGATGAVVGTTNTQTLTNKTLDDALTVKEITTPSTPSSGYKKIYANTDGKLYTVDDAGTETEVGAGAAGLPILERFYSEDFSVTSSTFFSVTGNAATPDNAGTGSMAGGLVTSSKGGSFSSERTVGFLTNGAGTNDFFLSDEIALEENQNGRLITIVLDYTYSGNTADMKFLFHDSTNDTVLSTSSDLIYACTTSSEVKRLIACIYVPENCDAVRYGFQNQLFSSLKTLSFTHVSLSTRAIDIYQNNLLTADVSSTSDMADLTFSNLEIGKYYRLGGFIYSNFATALKVIVYSNASGAGTEYGIIFDWSNGSGTAQNGSAGVNLTFRAVTTSVYFRLISPFSDTILGDNTYGETFIQLTELNNTVATTRF